MFIDSHCHLDRLNLDKHQGDLSLAIQAATDAKVSHMLCVGIDLNNANKMVELAEKYNNVFSSVGIHPMDTTNSTDIFQLEKYLPHPKIVALGETGLDFYYENDEDIKSQQIESFKNHLIIAKDHGLPVIVHSRNAREKTIDLINNYSSDTYSGVLHCFTETLDMATKAMDRNYMISISGIITFKNADKLRDVVKHIPLDRLLIETDSPYLAPIPYRGKPNEPCYVAEVAKFIAKLKSVSVEQLAECTTNNFFSLFAKAKKYIS